MKDRESASEVETSADRADTARQRVASERSGRRQTGASLALINTAWVGVPAAYVTSGSLVVTVITAGLVVVLVLTSVVHRR